MLKTHVRPVQIQRTAIDCSILFVVLRRDVVPPKMLSTATHQAGDASACTA